jgi:phage/plasmid-associated DNA primase
MPRPTTTIHAIELYNNKETITSLLNVETSLEDYPTDKQYLTKDEQTKLRNIIRGSKYDDNKDCYTKKIDFKKKKYGDIAYGRLYPDKPSIQQSKKTVRKTMFNDEVMGFDLTNSQPSILLQLCKKHAPNDKFEYLEKYVGNRDVIRQELMDFYKLPKEIVKDFMISLCFGQKLQNIYKNNSLKPNEFLEGFYKDTTKIKTKTCLMFPQFDKAQKVYEQRKQAGTLKEYNTKSNSSIAMYLQNIEGDIMLTVYELLKDDVQVVTVIHDEICFLNNDFVQNNKETIMCKMEETVKSKLGFDVQFHAEIYKKDEGFVERHQEFLRKVKSEPDDVRNGRVLYDILKDKARYSKKQGKWMYDDLTGLWFCDENDFKRIVYRYADEFIQTKVDKDGFIVEHHERDIGSMYRNIMEYFWTLVDECEKINSDNNRGFLLFKNGVLDCFNMEMLPFDPKYHFTKRINRNFDIEKDYTKDKEIVKQKIFETAYTTGDGDTEKMDYFMEILAFALMEGGGDKQYLTMLGETNCGKGVLTAFLENAFDEFISTFNTSVLMAGQNANLEDASRWRFLTLCYDTRIMIGNEIDIQSDDKIDAFGHNKKTERPLNIGMIKMLVSGGDRVKTRRMRENEITIVNKAFVLMLANDMPKTCGDKAFVTRSLVMNACRSSTFEESFDEKRFFKADKDIKQWIETDEACDALIALMCETYNKVKNNPTKTPEWVLETVKEYVSSEDSFQWVSNNYDIYKGDIVKDFDAVKNLNMYRVDWNKVGKDCVRADVMYNLYKDSGGTDSQTKFGKMLTDNGILLAQRKVKGIPVKYRVGVSLLEDDVKHPQMRNTDDDDNIDSEDETPKPWYPPSNYKPPEPVEPKLPSNQRTIFDLAYPSN